MRPCTLQENDSENGTEYAIIDKREAEKRDPHAPNQEIVGS